jgi:hypothetical protein
MDYIEYKLPYRKGIDDLKSLYAFHGASQGDETRTNSIEDYKLGWLVFIFNCELTDEAIAKEIEVRKAWNEEYVKELKEKGQYGEHSYNIMKLQYNPAFDNPNQKPVDFGEIDLWPLTKPK